MKYVIRALIFIGFFVIVYWMSDSLKEKILNLEINDIPALVTTNPFVEKEINKAIEKYSKNLYKDTPLEDVLKKDTKIKDWSLHNVNKNVVELNVLYKNGVNVKIDFIGKRKENFMEYVSDFISNPTKVGAKIYKIRCAINDKRAYYPEELFKCFFILYVKKP